MKNFFAIKRGAVGFLLVFYLAAPLFADCGIERWDVKTGQDSAASSVDLHPKQSTVGDLTALKSPIVGRKSIPRSSQEKQIVTITAVITAYKIETDSDIHLALQYERNKTMIAEIPDPGCMGKSPWKNEVARVREDFVAKVGNPKKAFKKVNIPVTLTGVVFFDFGHGQRGLAPNAVELHPVLNIEFP
jgi:hypothetical protein